MSNIIIQFLEVVGGKPLSAVEYAATVAALDVGEAPRHALMTRDLAALNDLLGGRTKMFFGIVAPHEEPMPDEEPAEDQPDEAPESIKLN